MFLSIVLTSCILNASLISIFGRILLPKSYGLEQNSVVLVRHFPSFLLSYNIATQRNRTICPREFVCIDAKLVSIPSGLKNAFASAIATGIVKTALQPFDTIKTLQQMQRASCQGSNGCIETSLGVLQTARAIIAQNGILGLWSGIGITVFGSSPSVAVYFGVYSSTKEFLLHHGPFPSQRLKLLNVALAAGIGNTIASVFRVPYEVLKQRVQAGQFRNSWTALLHSWRVDGPLGLFDSGKLSSQIVRDVPYAIFTLVSYELLQGMIQRLRRKQGHCVGTRRQLDDALCGSVAGGIGSLLTNPMDVVKTRLMTAAKGGSDAQSVVSCVRAILRDEGVSAFFIGTPARLMHKVPANGLFFLCYELFRTMFGVVGTGQGS